MCTPHSYSEPHRAVTRSMTISRCRSVRWPLSSRPAPMKRWNRRWSRASARNSTSGATPGGISASKRAWISARIGRVGRGNAGSCRHGRSSYAIVCVAQPRARRYGKDSMPTPKPGRRVRGSATGRPIMALLDLLGRRMTLRILWELRDRRLTFRALQEAADTNPSVLNARLEGAARGPPRRARRRRLRASRRTARACSPPSCRSTPGPTNGRRHSPKRHNVAEVRPLPFGGEDVRP